MAELELNYKNLSKNVKELKKSKKKIMAVVKNNAYNMGLLDCVKTFYKEGIDYFATTNIDECQKIREYLGHEVSIFLFNPTYDFLKVKAYNIEINIASLKYLQDNLEYLRGVVLHLEFAGSMRRAGARTLEEIKEIIDFCKVNDLNLKGFWSHFSFADEFDGNYEKEKELLLSIYNEIKGCYNFQIVHFQNSSSYLRDGAFEEATHIRPGISLYGSNPYNIEAHGSFVQFKRNQVFVLSAKVINLINLKEGQCIGYSNSYVADKDIELAVVDIGYGDGVLRSRLTGNKVIINKKEYKVVSTMMSHIIVEIDKNIKINDTVIIYNEDYPTHKFNKWCRSNSEQMAILNYNSLKIKKIY